MEHDQEREDRNSKQPEPRDFDDVKIPLTYALLARGRLGVEKETRLQRVVHGSS